MTENAFSQLKKNNRDEIMLPSEIFILINMTNTKFSTSLDDTFNHTHATQRIHPINIQRTRADLMHVSQSSYVARWHICFRKLHSKALTTHEILFSFQSTVCFYANKKMCVSVVICETKRQQQRYNEIHLIHEWNFFLLTLYSRVLRSKLICRCFFSA